jgi:hypothetical protein
MSRTYFYMAILVVLLIGGILFSLANTPVHTGFGNPVAAALQRELVPVRPPNPEGRCVPNEHLLADCSTPPAPGTNNAAFATTAAVETPAPERVSTPKSYATPPAGFGP